LVGGLVPRYLIRELPPYAPAHVGTTDIDLVIGIAVASDEREPYATLQKNLKDADFRPFKDGDGKTVVIEFLTEQGETPGSIVSPRRHTGSKIGAFEVRGAGLVAMDFVECEIEECLPNGDKSFAVIQVANLLPFLTLKTFALHDRALTKLKDAYDIVFILLNWPGGPAGAALAAAESPIYEEPVVIEALDLLARHFSASDMDGPGNYSRFLLDDDDEEEEARLRNVAAATVSQFVAALGR
jgi:hypothetical protein